jgi:heme-degrading monooxygenase HmoA
VIVRVFEARLKRGAEASFEAALRDDVAAARRQPGLVSIRWGRRRDDDALRVIVVSEWRDIDAIQSWLGPNWLKPRFAPGEDALVTQARIRHYEGLEP